MDALRKLPQLLRKYKFALLVLMIGIVLMLIPIGEKGTEETPLPENDMQQNVSEELSHILSQIDGVGQVQVMLTVAIGERVVYETDQNGDVVIVSDGDRVQSGLVEQIHGPTYQGAIVVCQGADRASVRLAVVEAVSNVTGLSADRISVFKMK